MIRLASNALSLRRKDARSQAEKMNTAGKKVKERKGEKLKRLRGEKED
jgi:hypothetical protein